MGAGTASVLGDGYSSIGAVPRIVLKAAARRYIALAETRTYTLTALERIYRLAAEARKAS